jgi:hypothetical protein
MAGDPGAAQCSHGGAVDDLIVHDCIPDDVHLQITVRAFKEETRKQILASIRFQPVPEPTIRTGVKAMTSAVLELLRK